MVYRHECFQNKTLSNIYTQPVSENVKIFVAYKGTQDDENTILYQEWLIPMSKGYVSNKHLHL